VYMLCYKEKYKFSSNFNNGSPPKNLPDKKTKNLFEFRAKYGILVYLI